MKLQDNFTTPEQSKRLLELELPADSADMYYCKMHTETLWSINVIGSGATYTSISTPPYDFMFVPCWSVGRLIEIYVIARGVDTSYLPIERGEDMVKYLIRLYEEKVKDLEFSKLEE